MPPINRVCHFCGSSDVILPEIGIAWGMGGSDYSFCTKCLSEMTALTFWQQMFVMHGYIWPPSLKEAANDKTA
jgi:hypothetical protein